MAKTHSGGGRTAVSQGVRGGVAAKGVNPGHVAALGAHRGNHATEGGDLPVRHEPKHTAAPYSTQLGNERTQGTAGAGVGRVIHRSGSQQTHGPADPGEPQPPARGILGRPGSKQP